ncbi:phosphotransferase family protein [Actinoplanes sp. HUAS TT8]|uniref:phosphotransferase family protein n=1 Tax=Actinoplanes sp. HUAS TT8 TaxID=3447453 RepID=UPI003F51EB0A
MVLRLLGHLREHGFDRVPEPRGFDERGREVLGFLPGHDAGWPMRPRILTDAGAHDLGRLARELRAALAGCPPAGPGASMQHGDLGPWNLLWDDAGAITGVLDWDLAEPGDPWYDTGFLAWFTVPFMDDEKAHARGFPQPPDRRARRAAFAAGTGVTPHELNGMVDRAQSEFAHRVATRDGVWRTFRERGFHDSARADKRWCEQAEWHDAPR